MLSALLLGSGACRHQDDPRSRFEQLQAALRQGDLLRVQSDAEKAVREFSDRDPAWSWKFRLLDATALSFRGMNQEVLSTLKPEVPQSLAQSDIAIEKNIREGGAYAALHRFDDARRTLAMAKDLCSARHSSMDGELLKTQGLFEIEEGNYELASQSFHKALTLARQSGDKFLESLALLDLGQTTLLQEHFDEAIEWSNATQDVSRAIDARLVTETALGNLGWAYYKTGDPERALALFVSAEQSARELGSLIDEIRWLTTSGYVYLDQKNLTVAQERYRKALQLARQINSKEEVSDALTSLAFVTVRTGDLDHAKQYADEAIAMARADGNRVDELYPLLAKGQVAARSGDAPQAEQTFLEVTNDPKVDLSLKWEAQHDLANLYLGQKNSTKADDSYRAALTTFETARAQIQHEGVKLPFLGNANSLYDDYVQFLVAQGKTDEALRVADYSRAQTLAEGLGILKEHSSFAPPAFDPRQIARNQNSTILFYWLGTKQSYLWAVTPREVRLLSLPPAAEIDDQVQNFRKALPGPRDLAESGNPSGTALYTTLLAPAKDCLPASPRVVVIPDGPLNTVNFETLVVPDPKPHYWIEDATIVNANSLRLLGAASQRRGQVPAEKLLLIGDALVPSPEYGQLPNARLEMADIGQHFPAPKEQVFEKNLATPAAYLSNHPERFSYIHFVAHGTASQLTPLDSAVVLSKASAQDDSFKLYAREIIQHPLNADLVTISACYGAGSRTYAGEGLVGLSWAFLRAGAHNVIGALWEVSDASTPQLMDKLYDDLAQGKRPEDALRSAKLSLLHSDGIFRKPFYWGPFQLYTGS